MAPLVAFIPFIAAGIGAATAGVELADQPKSPTAPTQAQTTAQQAQAQEAAAQAQASALQQRRGMASTVLQNPMSGGTASTAKATLGA